MLIADQSLNFAVAATVGLLKKEIKPGKRWKRPVTREETIRTIDATYALNDWGKPERAANARMLGLEAKPLAAYSIDELRVILDDLEFYKMILFEEETTSEN